MEGTPTAIKVDGIASWIHASHAKPAPPPDDGWTVETAYRHSLGMVAATDSYSRRVLMMPRPISSPFMGEQGVRPGGVEGLRFSFVRAGFNNPSCLAGARGNRRGGDWDSSFNPNPTV